MRVLAVIPARGGSKGIRKKNLAPLGGRPLLAWTVEAALSAKRLARVVVSTDDREIADLARSLGAEVLQRPAELATDAARAIPVLQHALAQTDPRGPPFAAVMMLQPTSPFRTAADIDAAVDLLAESGADSVISVVDVEGHHPARMKFLEDGWLVDPPFAEAYENQPRQELRQMFIRNGCVYLTRREILEGGSLKGKRCRALVMPPERSVNIDGPRELEYAEWLLSRRRG